MEFRTFPKPARFEVLDVEETTFSLFSSFGADNMGVYDLWPWIDAIIASTCFLKANWLP